MGDGLAAPTVGTPDALGVVRDLPAAVAAGTFHPPVALTVMNLQDRPEENRIGRVPMLALSRVAEGCRIERVEPHATVGGLLVEVLLPAFATLPANGRSPLRATESRGSAFMVLQSGEA
jgi:hypothetical protein